MKIIKRVFGEDWKKSLFEIAWFIATALLVCYGALQFAVNAHNPDFMARFFYVGIVLAWDFNFYMPARKLWKGGSK